MSHTDFFKMFFALLRKKPQNLIRIIGFGQQLLLAATPDLGVTENVGDNLFFWNIKWICLLDV